MSRTSVEVSVSAAQAVAFTRLHRHLLQSGNLAAAAASTVDEPRSLSYDLRLRGGTTQVTTLELSPDGSGCLLTMSVHLEHQEQHEDRGWVTPEQLEPQHRTLAEAFAHIADGSVEP